MTTTLQHFFELFQVTAQDQPTPSSIEIPHGWTIVIYHPSSKRYFDRLLLNGLTAGGPGQKGDKHVTSRPRILSNAMQYLIRKVGNHRSFLTFMTNGTDTIHGIDLVKAQDMGIKIYQTFSNAVVHVWRRSSRMCCKRRWTRTMQYRTTHPTFGTPFVFIYLQLHDAPRSFQIICCAAIFSSILLVER